MNKAIDRLHCANAVVNSMRKIGNRVNSAIVFLLIKYCFLKSFKKHSFFPEWYQKCLFIVGKSSGSLWLLVLSELMVRDQFLVIRKPDNISINSPGCNQTIYNYLIWPHPSGNPVNCHATLHNALSWQQGNTRDFPRSNLIFIIQRNQFVVVVQL